MRRSKVCILVFPANDDGVVVWRNTDSCLCLGVGFPLVTPYPPIRLGILGFKGGNSLIKVLHSAFPPAWLIGFRTRQSPLPAPVNQWRRVVALPVLGQGHPQPPQTARRGLGRSECHQQAIEAPRPVLCLSAGAIHAPESAGRPVRRHLWLRLPVAQGLKAHARQWQRVQQRYSHHVWVTSLNYAKLLSRKYF